MKEVMEASTNGTIINEVCYKTIRFADDIALLGNNEEELLNALHQINTDLKNKRHMMINKAKTKSHEVFQNENRRL